MMSYGKLLAAGIALTCCWSVVGTGAANASPGRISGVAATASVVSKRDVVSKHHWVLQSEAIRGGSNLTQKGYVAKFSGGYFVDNVGDESKLKLTNTELKLKGTLYFLGGDKPRLTMAQQTFLLHKLEHGVSYTVSNSHLVMRSHGKVVLRFIAQKAKS